MQSIMRRDATGTVHAPNSDRHNAATACGIVGGNWASVENAILCQACIRTMAAQVSKGAPLYRHLLKKALDFKFADDVDGTPNETHSETEPITLDICERGITYSNNSTDVYTISWKELRGMRDIVNASAGGVNKISIVTKKE